MRARPGKAVVDGELVYTSASALQKAHACLAQWFFRYVEGLPDKPPGAGVERGLLGHGNLEGFLLGRLRQDQLPPLEQLGITRGLVPPPAPDQRVEFPLDGLAFAMEVPLVGQVDLVRPVEGGVEITDWKFKADIGKWGSSADDLLDPMGEAGIQTIAYGAALGEARTVLRHVTFQTKGRPDVAEVRAEASFDKLSELWDSISRRLVPGMRRVAKARCVEPSDKNLSACNRYGGCPYINRCQDTMSRLKAGFFPRGSNMGMLFTGNSNAPAPAPSAPSAPVAAAAPAPVVPPAPVSPPAPVAIDSAGLIRAAKCTQGQVYLVNGQLGRFLCLYTTGGVQMASFTPVEGGGTPIKVSPEAEGGIVDSPPVLEAIETGILPPDAPAQVAPPVSGIGSAQTAPEVTPEVAPVKRGRGRPRKNPAPTVVITPADVEQPKTVEASQQEALEVLASAVSDAVLARSRPVVIATPEDTAACGAPPSGLYLYFRGVPVGVQTRTLDTYVEMLDAEIRAAAQLSAPDLRAAETQEFGFGRWKSFLAKMALEQLPRLVPGHYVVTGGDERVDVVAAALRTVADLVVV